MCYCWLSTWERIKLLPIEGGPHGQSYEAKRAGLLGKPSSSFSSSCCSLAHRRCRGVANWAVLILLVVSVLATGCTWNSAERQKLNEVFRITQVDPSQGDWGYTVRLVGSGFSGVSGVSFNGTPATSFIVNSDSQITVTAPAGASSGFISVTTPKGRATSTTRFTYYLRPNFPGLADTSANVHLYMPFNTHVNDPNALSTATPPVDLVWGWNNGKPTNVSGVTKLYYIPYDRDEDPTYFRQAHDLAWYQTNHHDWIEYQCDRTTIAYEFGEPNVPLDKDNPAVQQYIEQTYLIPMLKPGTGWNGIAFDNPNFHNAGTWTGQRCGHYDQSGTWVQQYKGTDDDPAYRQSILNWTRAMQAWLHRNVPGKIMAVNFSYDSSYSAQSDQELSYIDLDADEQGFTNGNNAPPWQYTDSLWLEKMQHMLTYLHQGGGFKSTNQEPVPWEQITNAQVEWALANYLLLKNNASGMWICGHQEYGNLYIRQEYAAAKVGAPTDDMHENPSNTYIRDFTTGLALVNPSSTARATVALPGSYYDLYGNAVSGQIQLPPATGMVLVSR